MEKQQGERFDDEHLPDSTPEESPASAESHGVRGSGREAGSSDGVRLGAPSSASSIEDLVSSARAHIPGGRRKGYGQSRIVKRADAQPRPQASGAQRLLILDTWVRSKLPAREFASLFGLSPHTLYSWKQRFDELGPAGLESSGRRGPRGSQISEISKRAILMMKSQHPEWGQDRIHAMLLRTEGLAASPNAIARVLEENDYVTVSQPTKPHAAREPKAYSSKPNQLWQTDLFTFILRRENRRVWMVAYMDDFSRFIVGYGVYASSSGALVREVLEACIANFGAPLEVLTDNGPQYHTWRGTSAFTHLLNRRGIKHVVASPRRPQTLGKVERFWGTLWRELLEAAIVQGLDDARRRIGHFIDHYNFQRTHTGIDGLVPADRYFAAQETVKQSLKDRVALNALSLAKDGAPRKSFYLTGRVGDETIALHAQGGRVVLTKGDGTREEVDLANEGRRVDHEDPPSMPEPVAVRGGELAVMGSEVDASEAELSDPGTSALDEALDVLSRGQVGDGDASVVDECDVSADDVNDTDDEDEDGLAGAVVRS